ncbi:hypothetical protein [Curvibacter lanceolatus]|uniref:hypothetical protein n=1 Tax=Curvibacter lanceolatus TaxID=86182 RepID=UPI0012FB5409|nr:hypothetical protein [Curvibacter lanceolatus]
MGFALSTQPSPSWLARALLTFGIGIAQAGTSPQHVQVLTAQEVRKLLIGQTITDGYHWRYHLKSDGSIDALELGRARKGRWHFDAHLLCINIIAGAAPSACWELIHDDKGLALGFQGHPVQDIQIIPTQR